MSAANAMSLSVVIPHLNQERALARCLRSLADQRGVDTPFEVVVVDNGSDRIPTELCRDFPAVRLDREVQPGPGPARNRGVSLSSGSIVAFLDADCIAEAGWCAAIERVFRDPRVCIAGGAIQIARRDPHRPTLLEAYESVFGYRQQWYIERRGFAGTGNLAVRRSDFERVGPFAGIHKAEDLDWGRRARALGYEITYAPEMQVSHPARETFAAVHAKWDRQIAHTYERFSRRRWVRLRWTSYTVAVALSPLVEWVRVLRSPRLHSLRERALAWVGVTRVRGYRARQMAAVLFGKDRAAMSASWNRSPRASERG